MKTTSTVLIFTSVLVAVFAVPPRFTFARQQAAPAPAAPSAPAAPAESAPYPPSGWKPAGPEFPPPSYGPPTNTYGPPPSEYGPPETTTEGDSTPEIETTPPKNVQSLVKQGRVDRKQRFRQQLRNQPLILLDDGVDFESLQQGRLSRVQILDRDNIGGAVLRPAYVQIYQ